LSANKWRGKETKRLTRLVADLLALAESDEFGEDDVDLNRVVHEAIAQIQLTRLATDRTMAPIQAGVLPAVRGSSGLLRQAFVNLH
jgi:signal transduction histidine kinase